MVGVAALGWFGAVREHAVHVDQGVRVFEPVGGFVGLDMDVPGQVDDRLDGHVRVGVAAPFADLVHADRGPGVAAPADGLAAGQRVLGDVDDQVNAAAGLGVVEPEGELAAGEVTQGLGAANVQRLGRAQVGLLLGAGADHVLEIQPISQVDLGVDVDGAVIGDLVDPDIDVLTLCCLPPFRFGGCGVEPHHRVLDRTVQLGPGTRVRHRREVPVDMRGTLDREGHGLVGDPERPPHRQLPGDHPVPQPREAVAELQCAAEVGVAGVGGQAARGGVLHRRELRDQRRTFTGERDRAVTEEPVIGVAFVGLDLVDDCPLDGGLEDWISAASRSAW